MESNEHLDWFETLDEFLDEQDIVLQALKHGLTAGNLSQEDYQEYAQEYIKHRFEKPM